jgi:prephenate dehydrogenase
MRSSGTGAHAPVEVMSPTKVRSGFFEPETRLVWSDVDAYGNMIMRNVPKTPKAVIEAAKAAKRVKAAKAAKAAKEAKAAPTTDSGVTIVRDAAGRPLKADPVRPT